MKSVHFKGIRNARQRKKKDIEGERKRRRERKTTRRNYLCDDHKNENSAIQKNTENDLLEYSSTPLVDEVLSTIACLSN